MINHIRTLLLNRSATETPAVGDEFIEPGFQPAVLTGWMADIQSVLYPAGLSDYQRNLRTLSLMQLLHQIDLLQYINLFDPRITYSLTDNYFNRIQLAGLQVTGSSTETTVLQTVFFADQDPRNLNTIAGSYRWDYTVAYAGTDIVAERYGTETRERRLTFAGGSSNHLVLIPNYLLVYFKDPTNHLTGKFHYTITLQVPLVFDPLAMLTRFERFDLTSAIAAQVFAGWDDYNKELQQLREIWYQSSEALQRFGAFVLAFAIQLERVRRKLPLPHNGNASSVTKVL